MIGTLFAVVTVLIIGLIVLAHGGVAGVGLFILALGVGIGGVANSA